MNIIQRTFASVLTAALIPAILQADVTFGVDPGYVKVKVYEVRISASADCTNGITVFRNDSPELQDWMNSPTLGSGAIPNGTYNCIMLRMSDHIHYTPGSDHPSWTQSPAVCVVGTDYALDVAHTETGIDPDGTQHPFGARGTENIAWLYIRTGGSNDDDTSAWQPSGGLPLTSPLVVSGDRAQTMVFDFSGRIGEENDSGWVCGCDAPSMSFR